MPDRSLTVLHLVISLGLGILLSIPTLYNSALYLDVMVLLSCFLNCGAWSTAARWYKSAEEN